MKHNTVIFAHRASEMDDASIESGIGIIFQYCVVKTSTNDAAVSYEMHNRNMLEFSIVVMNLLRRSSIIVVMCMVI